MPAEIRLVSLLVVLYTRSLSEAVNVGWMAIFASVWIVEWIRHRQIPATS